MNRNSIIITLFSAVLFSAAIIACNSDKTVETGVGVSELNSLVLPIASLSVPEQIGKIDPQPVAKEVPLRFSLEGIELTWYYKDQEIVPDHPRYLRHRESNEIPKVAAKNLVEKPEIHEAIIPEGTRGRRPLDTMEPKFITIHSTQNYSWRANAKGHADYLQHGGRGSLAWHFSVDQSSIYQSLPLDEQGRHSDFGGSGDQTSIGIEMCENHGNSREETLELTSHLIAWLMQTHDIPLENVVPHYHWRMIQWPGGRDMGHKNCPHFLMDDKKPGDKWQGFLDQIALVIEGRNEINAPASTEVKKSSSSETEVL